MHVFRSFKAAGFHRRSIRLKGYDYSSPGKYFITLKTKGNRRLFGKIKDGEMILSESGRLVDYVWNELPVHNPHISLDAYVIMPDHFHGIIIINPVSDSASNPKHRELSEIIRQLKSYSAKKNKSPA